mmetsp:Transcript_1484/g.4384  ORF Transcript_1484/g.4384 Transcript_1484/m.4384 type:complete len:267 (+) Transcript_1484:847-1647(+)
MRGRRRTRRGEGDARRHVRRCVSGPRAAAAQRRDGQRSVGAPAPRARPRRREHRAQRSVRLRRRHRARRRPRGHRRRRRGRLLDDLGAAASVRRRVAVRRGRDRGRDDRGPEVDVQGVPGLRDLRGPEALGPAVAAEPAAPRQGHAQHGRLSLRGPRHRRPPRRQRRRRRSRSRRQDGADPRPLPGHQRPRYGLEMVRRHEARGSVEIKPCTLYGASYVRVLACTGKSIELTLMSAQARSRSLQAHRQAHPARPRSQRRPQTTPLR